ncbi:hypothetical protein RE428_48880 (plasmid) [Marinobacter nanhaiticus D15-8W]|uniref:Conjugal transfer protein n=1 Tax=Marinobacter nanhaiticus D15-8W TaxID=626887 RepID=N6X139_9GAMM|nr:VirB8/TrbF family protein [Marinobacter nanhaiticus]ENO17142.1 conjugal transfer protein [Marinobacter nanhaiticus D15-8W]BES73870.1 hypothetical protein RE428_48880 [Marinobacter nanhaiticus D15-8W]
MTANMDDAAFKAASMNSDEPKRRSETTVDRNRWFIFSIFLLVLCFFMGAFAWYGFKKSANNTELVWVKLYPDGTWDVSEFKPQDQQLFFKSTVDALLEKYLVKRFGVLPETVKRDYAEAATFMSPSIYQNFVDTQANGGFDAIQKAADIQADTKRATRIEIEWRFADHYDQVPAVFGKEEGQAIRTNVYFTRTRKTSTGMQIGEPEHLIARLQWRLLSKQELAQKSQAWLRSNPIGLQIISQDVIDDPAAEQAQKEGN